MDLQLDEKAEVLRRTLSSLLGELRMEISNTEKYDLRESLKGDEERIKAILAKIG
jgi:hypothetical protein